MAVEDRDQMFEKALAKHLRSANANALHAPSGCLDAETLAAYHENCLTDEQENVAKRHLLSCERCQEILEQLKATEQLIPDQVAAETESLSSGVAAGQSQASGAAGGIHVLKPRRPQIWRWVAPAGALAAAVLVWIAVRETPSLRKAPVNEITQTSGTTLPATPPSQTLPEAVAKARPPEADPLVARPVPAPPRGDAVGSGLSDSRSAATYAPSPSRALPKNQPIPSPKPSGVASGRPEDDKDLKREELQLSRDMAANEEKRKLDESTDSPQQVIIPQPSGEQAAAAVGGALSRSTTAERAESSKALKKRAAAAPTAPTVVQEQQVDGMSLKEAPGVLLANATGAVLVAVPGGGASWRIGPSGFIAHSADRGKTWTPQASGVTADLLSGTAISNQICWIVGRAGTVLRTTDGGGHWQKVAAPTEDDLLSISTTDARQATVKAAVGAYQTTDGGATWHKVTLE